MQEYTPEHIWLLTGYAGSGKDVTAELLTNIIGQHMAVHTAFANAVKDEVSTLYMIDRASLDTQKGKGSPVSHSKARTVRDLLIDHAETAKMVHGLAVWANRLKAPNTLHWILSDWRFMEELVTLQTRFPRAAIHTLRVHRPGVEPLASYTEHNLDTFRCKYTIENEGSLLYIGNQLLRIVQQTARNSYTDSVSREPV